MLWQNRCHVDKFMYSPVLCLQSPIPLFAYWFLFGNGSPMYSVHKLQPASNSRMLWDICSWNIWQHNCLMVWWIVDFALFGWQVVQASLWDWKPLCLQYSPQHYIYFGWIYVCYVTTLYMVVTMNRTRYVHTFVLYLRSPSTFCCTTPCFGCMNVELIKYVLHREWIL